MKHLIKCALILTTLCVVGCVNTTNVGGTWKYTLVDDQNLPIPNTTKTVLFTQNDGSFSGENDAYRFVGSVYERNVDFFMVVSGETLEGFVRHVEGAVDGKKLYGTFHDSHGGIGSFVASRQP